MYVKMKSYFLKQDVKPEELVKYGFEKCGDNYSKKLEGLARDIRYYHNTGRIIFVDYPWKESRYRKVKKYISDLIKDGLVELKVNYEWWAIIGRWQDYNEEKKARIETEIDRRNNRANEKERQKEKKRQRLG